MADITVDSLSIDVSVNSQNAINSLDKLSNTINKLTSTLNKLDKLTTFFARLKDVTNDIKLDNLDKGSDFITKLSTMPKISLTKKTVENFTNLLKTVKEYGDINVSNITELANAIHKMSTSPIGGLGTNIRSVTSAVNNTKNAKTKSKKPKINYLKLFAGISSLKMAFDSVSPLLAKTINDSSDYVEDLNLFTVSLGKYADASAKYAMTVSEALGINPVEWLRSQGVFNTIITGFGVAEDKAERMSKTLTQLGYDISSFYNLSVQESMTKLRSGISGELEPLRQLGYDLSVARLQDEAYRLGIEKKVSAMTQAEKSQLRYYAIMTQVTAAQGDMARTLSAPANQMRILIAQTQMLSMSLGNLFIPIINRVLPYIIAFVKLLRLAAVAIANFFNVNLPEMDTTTFSNIKTTVDNATDSVDDLNSGLGGTKKRLKEIKDATLGIDELNIISKPDDTDSGGGGRIPKISVPDLSDSLNIPLPTYEFLSKGIDKKIDNIVEKFKKWKWLIGAVTLGIATLLNMGVAARLAKIMQGVFGINEALTGTKLWTVNAGLILSAAGAIAYFTGVVKALQNGVNWKNLLAMLGGLSGIIAGLYLLLKPFNKTGAKYISGIAGIAGAIGVLVISLKDIKKNGANLENLLGIISSIGAGAFATSIFIKHLYTALQTLSKVKWISKIKDILVLKDIATLKLTLGIGGFIAGLVVLSNVIGDIIKNGANAKNVLILIGTAVGTITAAVIALNTVCSINPILGGVLAVGMIVAGITTVIASINNAKKAIWEASEEGKKIKAVIEDAKAAAEVARTSTKELLDMKANLQNPLAKYIGIQNLIDDIYRLSDKTNKTKEEFSRLNFLVNSFNSMNLGDIKLQIDETTQAVTNTKEEVKNLIKELQNKALSEAFAEILENAYKQQIEGAIASQNLTDRLNETKKALDDLKAAGKDTDLVGSLTPEAKELQKALNELNTAFEENKIKIENANKTIEDSSKTYDDLSRSVTDTYKNVKDTIEQNMNDIQRINDDFAEKTPKKIKTAGQFSVGNLKEQFSKIKDISKQAHEDTYSGFLNGYYNKPIYERFKGIGVNIIDGIITGVEAKKEKLKQNMKLLSKNALNTFKDELQIHSPSKLFAIAGSNIVEGVNVGIDRIKNSSIEKVKDYASSISDTFNPDIKDLNAPNLQNRKVYTQVTHSVSNQGFIDNMQDFYRTYIEPTIKEMASDVKVQANKKEQTIVNIGGRMVAETISEYRAINGYRFQT